MSLINVYLKGTLLTSTKNKLLEDEPFTDNLERCEELNENLKRQLKRRLVSKKCLTENKILLENKFHVWEDDFPKKKKKKAKRDVSDEHDLDDFPKKRKKKAKRDVSDAHDFGEILGIVTPKCSIPIRKRTAPACRRSAPAAYFGHVKLSESSSSDSCSSDRDRDVTGVMGDSAVENVVECAQEVFQDSCRISLSSQAQSFAFGAAKAQSSLFGSYEAMTAFKKLHSPSFPDSANIPEIFISKMPTYKFEVLNLCEETEYDFLTLHSKDTSSLAENFVTNLKMKKMQLLNVVSMALMYTSNLKNDSDNYRESLQKSADEVRLIDPEFILKVALYARQELHIRNITNFLLSYAAVHENTRIYLEKYFEAAIVLPSDWIKVAEYYQVVTSGTHKQSLPAALRRVMKKTFSKFDQYQLAKYNKVKRKKNPKIKEDSEVDEESENNDEGKKVVKSVDSFTLKKLIRLLHIDSPTEHVMSLLGKKYPESHTAFKSCGLPGAWDPTKAGKRMKLPIPETWETQISLNGNKAFVWESLIDNNKLPYMATLRNLKNLILSGISPEHHKKAIKHLENKNAVIKSRQLPMQFFEAYKVVVDLENVIEGDVIIESENSSSQYIPPWKRSQLQKIQERIHNASVSVLEQYKSAISKALEISSLNNLHPIPGKTLVICLIDVEISSDLSNAAKAAKVKQYETCIMMGLMCLKACEDCKMNILCCSNPPDAISLNEKDQFLDVMRNTCERYRKLLTDINRLRNQNYTSASSSLEKILDYYLRPQTMLSLKLDHVVLLHISSNNTENVMSSFLHKYRQIVNSHLLYTNVNFNLSSGSFCGASSSEKDVYLCGSSSSLVKFIAERSSGGQLIYVENIDLKYNLPEISVSKKFRRNVNTLSDVAPTDLSGRATSMPLNYKMPKWHTVRIFISSTFKDMMSERDLLVRYVFPELRRRAASVFVRIVEIDLRWGITEADSATKRAAELCLIEAQKADLFVGLIGERYGTIYDFETPDAAELKWVEKCPGLSITELEMHAAALRKPNFSMNKAFFYFRDNSFSSHIPQKWTNHFVSEDLASKTKVEALKTKIKMCKFKVLDSYPCHWAGIFENKPVLGGLDVLGGRVLDDLWGAVQDIHKTDPYCDGIGEEEMYQQNLIDSQNFFIKRKNSPMENIIKRIKSENGICVICGCSGSGKTAFAINLLQKLNSYTVVKFFIGVSPRSRDLSYMIQYICNSICQQLSISIPLPDLALDIVNQFPDILLEASNCSGGREFILMIDGLDHLENNDQRLDWLPLTLPNNVKLICLVSESSQAFKVLCERQVRGNDIFVEELTPLQQSDREKLVRSYLSYYCKTLDESAFSNHLLKIVTKKDSSKPFYLRVVCDFLRIYASFENLVSMLQKLPSSVSFLFQEIILQMENEFGSTLIQTVLTLLCITEEGFEDNDLHFVLSFIMHMNELQICLSFDELKEKIQSFDPEHFLCQVKYCTLTYVINTFAFGQIRQKSLTLKGSEFEEAVKKFYLNKNCVFDSNYMHFVLAAYYHNLCDLNNDGKFNGRSGFAFRSLLYHMFNGSLYKELSHLLCSHRFIEAVFWTNVGDQLLDYYSSLLYDILPSNQKVMREIDSYQLFSYYDFVSRNFHIFHQYPQLVMQQALNEPQNSAVILTNKDCDHQFFENLSRSHLLDYRLATLCGFVKKITASAGSKRKPIVMLGSEDGYLKVLDLSTRRVIRTIKSHVSAITCICFVGKNRLCASSVDGTLSLWDTDDFSRIAVLNGHRHNVTSCCADPSSSILFSSGWDNSVRLWSLVDGRSISTIEEFRCPVNCIDHHPVKQQIACGLWSGNIEIWDTLSMKKILAFSSFSGSVKSLAYTPDGVNIISSFIESEISIWSSEEGLKISSLKGHILPVKSLSYSFDGSIFVSGSDDCTLKVWSAVRGSHYSTISDCKFCSISLMDFMSENFLAVAFQNAEIWIIDINSGNVTSKITLASDFVSAFSKFSYVTTDCKDSENNLAENSILFGTQAGKLMVVDLLTSSTTVRAEMNSKITAVNHNCNAIFCGTAEGDIGIFSYSDDVLNKIIFAAHRGFVTTFSLVVKCGELFVLSTANDNVLKIWHIDWSNLDVTLQQELHNHHKDCITYSLFYPYFSDSELLNNLLTGSHDNNIISWNEDTVKVFQGLQSSIVNIACSDDYILGCGNDGAIVMWSRTGKILTSIPRIELSSSILTFYVVEDESNKFRVLLAFVDQDGSIKINKPLQRTYGCSFEGHSKPVTSCCTTENGDVISCSLDGSVNLWKVPSDIPNHHLMHTSVITGIILSPSFQFAISSDAHGNLILWKIESIISTVPLTYIGKKSYFGGFIRALSWLKDNDFACAVSQVTGSEEKYFLQTINFKCSTATETTTFNFQVKKSYHFESEILCLDSCSRTEIIVVGLKSGDVIVIESDVQKCIKLSDDWLLGVCLFTKKEVSDFICASFVDGSIKLYSVAETESFHKNDIATSFATYEPTAAYNGSKFPSSMVCGEDRLICCGDSEGVLRIYFHHSLKFIEKVHDDSISGTCIVGSYLFTSSLDKSVKGWNLKSFKQICQFHSSVPISCLYSPKIDVDTSTKNSCLLLIGTTSGDVHLLKFHCK